MILYNIWFFKFYKESFHSLFQFKRNEKRLFITMQVYAIVDNSLQKLTADFFSSFCWSSNLKYFYCNFN